MARIAIAAGVQLAIPSVPPIAEAFRVTPLYVVDIAMVAVLALAPAVLAEILGARARVVWVA